ncbi:MAG TPA: metallophosphoesterase family protein, partial [bacterium]|nr:metallophosphoesterase family protein [bacterium]
MRGLASLLLFSLLAVATARAERFVYEPVSDADDGQLVDGFSWDSNPGLGFADALLNLGQEGASTYDNSLAFRLTDLAEGQSVAHAVLRLNEQGGAISSGLTVQISGALSLDPLAAAGAARFALPRTANTVFWTIPAAWDSSGQRIAKYEETPDLSPVIEEIIGQSGWDAGAKDAVLFLEVFSAVGDNVVRYDDLHGSVGGNAGIEPGRLIVCEGFRDAFWGKELLCRPQPGSVEVNVIPHAAADAYVEWGTDGISFPFSTAQTAVAGQTAHEFLINGLSSDTRYSYRLQSRPAGGGAFEAGPVRSFVTLPVPGEEARICLTADIHVTNQLALGLDSQMSLLEDALDFMSGYLADPYHAWVDLGDLVVIRAQRVVLDQEETEQRYRTAREYVDLIGHSVPLVAIRGNHEEVNGWDDDGSPNNSAIWSGKMLLKYFPPPLPDAFVSGNDVSYPNLGLPGNYFAFDIGSVRLRALDPFLFSTTRPHNGHGETGGSLNGWDWTLGQQQYDWLRDDLIAHPSTFSVVGIHHLTSCYAGPGQYYGRGGV